VTILRAHDDSLQYPAVLAKTQDIHRLSHGQTKWPTFNHNVDLRTNFQLLTD